MIHPATVLHHCPVCGKAHDVPEILHRLSYGRQLTCGPACKAAFRRLVRSRILEELARRAQPGDPPLPLECPGIRSADKS